MIRSLIKVAGGAVTGLSHERDGLPCQDKFFTWRSKNKKDAGISLSDGAGSSPYSQWGAERVVKVVIPFVMNNFEKFYDENNRARLEIYQYLRMHLEEVAQVQHVKFHHLACTLLFVCIRRQKDKVRYISGSIGDGAFIVESNGCVNVLFPPYRGEFANTTAFLTSSRSDELLNIKIGVLKSPCGFIIMSDGTAETLFVRQTQSPNQIYCRQILNWCNKYKQNKVIQILYKNLESGIFREISMDDCSLAILKVT